MDPIDGKMIERECYKHLMSINATTLMKWENSLKNTNCQESTHEEIDNMSRLIFIKEIKFVV